MLSLSKILTAQYSKKKKIYKNSFCQQTFFVGIISSCFEVGVEVEVFVTTIK